MSGVGVGSQQGALCSTERRRRAGKVAAVKSDGCVDKGATVTREKLSETRLRKQEATRDDDSDDS